MKRTFLLSLMVIVSVLVLAQPKTVEYQKENDFMLLILDNPKVSIRKFILCGISTKNTQFLSEERYRNSKAIQRLCREVTGQFSVNHFHKIYKKAEASYKVLNEMQNVDSRFLIEVDMFDYLGQSYQKEHPEIMHKLSIVPLKLDDIK